VNLRRLLSLSAALLLAVAPSVVRAQGVTNADIAAPLKSEWLSYNGDYTARRYSALTAVNKLTVKHLSLAWTATMTAGDGLAPASSYSRTRPNLITGGEGAGGLGAGNIKGSIMEHNGLLYVTAPDNVWQVDARNGEVLWHYYWKTRGGTHIGNRGVALYKDWVFFETPDDYLVSLDAKTGKERWHKKFADVEGGYFSTPAPLVIKNHLMVGTGNDIDAPSFLWSFDPETGEQQWKWNVTPQKSGDPGLDSWKNLDAARHGGGGTWVTGAYDPETNLYIIGTGNPTPSWTNGNRGDGDNLYACAMVALDVDTGKMKWYVSTSPHDTHDYDSAQTPVIVNGIFKGKPRKLVIQAARNGYFFVVDRVTGELLLTTKYGETTNWSNKLTPRGGPYPDPLKDASIGGSLISPASGGTVNWQPPAYSPQTGLLYQYEANTFSEAYLTDPDPRGAMGLGGKEEQPIGTTDSYIDGIDYKTGQARWRHRLYAQSTGGGGLLATAGGLVFSGDAAGNLIALDAATGAALWGSRIGSISNAPQTFMLDGHQYVIAASGLSVYAFELM
jgi:alcohol dehydrogenase (cytochrome c)